MDSPSLNGTLIMGQCKAIVTAFLLKRGVFGEALKEVLKGVAQMRNGHLGRVFRHVQHPGKLVSFHGVEWTPQGRLERLRHCGIGLPDGLLVLPVVQGPIVGKAGDPRRLAKIRLLHICI